MSLVEQIIGDLEKEGIKLKVLSTQPGYRDGPLWENADKEQVEKIIAKSIVWFILKKE